MMRPGTLHFGERAGEVHSRQAGIVMLLALIALLLISAVGASILFMASGESVLVGRQRTSTQVVFGGIAGLEEARMRLNPTDPNYLCLVLPAGSCDAFNPPNLLFPSAVGEVIYIINPANPGDVISPTNAANRYFDWEYQNEFGVPITDPGVVIRTVNSEQVAAAAANPPWPVVPEKWVRITVKTEQAARQDISGDALYDNAIPVYFDSDTLRQIVNPDCPIGGPACPEGAKQVYRLTSLAMMPDGTQRIVQYDVGSRLLVINFPSAITMVGSGLNCNFANSAPFEVDGTDQAGVPGEGGPAIGVINPAEDAACTAGIPPLRVGNYDGTDGTNPSVTDISADIDPDLLTTAGLMDLMDLVRQYADQTYISPQAPTYYGQCSAGVNNPLITVVEGDLQIAGNTEGCGILLVTGTLTLGGTPKWNGIVLVIGEGELQYSGGGNDGIRGTVLVAKIFDPLGNPLPAPVGSSYSMPGGGTADIKFNSMFINTALNRVAYRILAFREVSR